MDQPQLASVRFFFPADACKDEGHGRLRCITKENRGPLQTGCWMSKDKQNPLYQCSWEAADSKGRELMRAQTPAQSCILLPPQNGAKDTARGFLCSPRSLM